MEGKCINKLQANLCINTEKVYDWIIEESTLSTTVPVGSLPITLPADATDIKVDCILTDENGTPLPLNSLVEVTETGPREDQVFTIRNQNVTLQRVTFTKILYLILRVSGVDPATGNQFLITTDPASFTFVESAFLCAPVGTSLMVRITDFACQAIVNRNQADEVTGFGINAFICQGIQVVAPVTIELNANYCTPREALTEQCAGPSRPAQCPIVFPGE